MWAAEDAEKLNSREEIKRRRKLKRFGFKVVALLTKDAAYNRGAAHHELRTISHRQHPENTETDPALMLQSWAPQNP